MASKPWYYVKGRKDLIESRLSKKREKEAFQQECNSRNDKYFQRWRLQNQLLTNWTNMPKKSNNWSFNTPYDLDYDPFDTLKKQEEAITIKSNIDSDLVQFWNQIKSSEKEAFLLRTQEAYLYAELEQLFDLKFSLETHRDTWKIKEKICHYKKFAKDKLRLKAFHNNEQLNYYKMCIRTLNNSSVHQIVTEEEELQLSEVVKASLNIIESYIQLNSQRNVEFVILYNEEAEIRLKSQEVEWNREKKVWANLVDSVLDAYFIIYKTKLEETLEAQERYLSTREEQLQSLWNYIEKAKSDNKKKPFVINSINNFGAIKI